MPIPEKGLAPEEILGLMREAQGDDADWRRGRTFSLVYHAGEEHTRLLEEAYRLSFSENGLSPVAFPSLRHWENQTVAMAADLLGGGGEACGSLTSCGTESILMAVKSARDQARAERGVEHPQMLLPITAHPAFEKAAHYLGVEPVRIGLGPDLRAHIDQFRKSLNERTVLLVGSAPCYPYGVIDPIPELAALAAEHHLPCHVDACLGGFLLPWLRELGFYVAPFDFSVPGVTSISADLHKYGFSAKGASCILYRDRNLRRYQYFAYPDWPGGIYVSPSMTGTRPGGAIAAAWATLMHLGRDGYRKLATDMMATTRKILDGIRSTPGLRVLGEPVATVFAFTMERGNVYSLGEAMERLGWNLDRLQNPAALHLMITPPHRTAVDAFLADLRTCAARVAADSSSEVSGMAAIYGMMSAIEDRQQAAELALGFLDQLMTPER